MDCNEASLILDACVDGELELSRQLEVETHLAVCPACRKSAAKVKNDRESLRMNILVYEAPPELKMSIRAALRKETKPHITWTPRFRKPLLCAIALLVLSLVGGWLWTTASRDKDRELISQAISNHAHSLLVDHVLDVASSDQNTIRPWFTEKLNYSPPIADLSGTAYKLIGGRIDMLEKRPVAAIVYQYEDRLINVFVWPSTDHAIVFEDKSVQGFSVCGWHKAGLNYLIVSKLGSEEMENLEDQIRDRIQ
jgi:anti-sigma factor RsiW